MVAYLAWGLLDRIGDAETVLWEERALEEGRKVGEHRSGGSEGLFREHPKGYQPPGKLARFVDMTLWVVFYPLVLVIKKMEGIE